MYFNVNLLLICFFALSLSPTQQDVFQNPKLSFPVSLDMVGNEAIYQYYSTNNYELRSYYQLVDFCNYIKNQFKNSDMTITESNALYSIIEKNLEFHDESYGFPTRFPPIPEYNIRKRVMLKKINSNNYEIFYWLVGCGIKYYYQSIIIHNNNAIECPMIQRWRISNPC